MLCLVLLSLTLTQIILSTAGGPTEKFQIACLQLQEGTCNSSRTWLNVCIRAAGDPDSRIKSPRRANNNYSIKKTRDGLQQHPLFRQSNRGRKSGTAGTSWTENNSQHGNNKFKMPDINGGQLEKPQLYKLMKKSLTWAEAREACLAGGGWLAKLDQPYKWQYLTKHNIHPVGFWSYMWIGLKYDPRLRQFFWSDGSKLQTNYGKWKYGEPSHTYHGSAEDCVGVSASLYMNDRGCSKTSRFLCEYKPPHA